MVVFIVKLLVGNKKDFVIVRKTCLCSYKWMKPLTKFCTGPKLKYLLLILMNCCAPYAALAIWVTVLKPAGC